MSTWAWRKDNIICYSDKSTIKLNVGVPVLDMLQADMNYGIYHLYKRRSNIIHLEA